MKDVAYTLTYNSYSGGTIQTPSSATITIRKPGGGALATPVTDAVMTISGNDMTYALTAGNTAELGANYKVDVAYVVSGVTYRGQSVFDVVRRGLQHTVIAADLAQHQHDYADYLNSGESAQTHITRAYLDVCSFLQSQGRRPYLVLDPEEMRDAIEYGSLARIFGSHSAGESDRTAGLRDRYLNLTATAMAALGPKLVYDMDQSGTADGTSVDALTGEEGGISTGYRIRI